MGRSRQLLKNRQYKSCKSCKSCQNFSEKSAVFAAFLPPRLSVALPDFTGSKKNLTRIARIITKKQAKIRENSGNSCQKFSQPSEFPKSQILQTNEKAESKTNDGF